MPTYNRDWMRASMAKLRAENPKLAWLRGALAKAKQRARAKGIPFNLNSALECPDRCPVLGFELNYLTGLSSGKRGGAARNSPSLDRLIPSLGYVFGNVVVISHHANLLKSNGTVEEIEKVLRYLRSNIA